MPALIKPGSVQVLTQDGEVRVSITLELNINLNSDGVQVSAQSASIQPVKEKATKVSDDWMVPDFAASPKLNFGKRE